MPVRMWCAHALTDAIAFAFPLTQRCRLYRVGTRGLPAQGNTATASCVVIVPDNKRRN